MASRLGLCTLLLACACIVGADARQLQQAPAPAPAPAPVVPNITGVNIHGFTFRNNVGSYLMFTQDACDITAALSKSPPDFATAMGIFETGKNAPSRSGGFRNLKGFTTGAYYAEPAETREKYIAFYNDPFFMNTAVEQAIKLTPPAVSAQVLLRIPQDMVLFQFVLHEMEEGLNKTRFQVTNHTDPRYGGRGNLDESWAMYAGTPGCGLFSNSLAMAKSFGTLRNADYGKGPVCVSAAHKLVLAAYERMAQAALSGDYAQFSQGHSEVLSALAIPYIQGALKGAFEVSKRVQLGQDASIPLAQGFASWRVIQPLAAAINNTAAGWVSEAFYLGQAPAADTFIKVKTVMDSLYAGMGIDPSKVGTPGSRQFIACNGSLQALKECLKKCSGPGTTRRVCASDGKSYRNACAAQCRGVQPIKRGRCSA